MSAGFAVGFGLLWGETSGDLVPRMNANWTAPMVGRHEGNALGRRKWINASATICGA
jgi:hypothetical protein